MKHIKSMGEFIFEGDGTWNDNSWWSGRRDSGTNSNGSPRDEIIGWYNMFGRALLAIPTLGTNILIEKGIDYVKNKIEENKTLKIVFNKLRNDELINNYLNEQDISYTEEDEQNDQLVIVKRRIKEILTREEYYIFINHIEFINNKFGH